MTIDQFKGVVADLARPFAIISSSAAAAVAVVVIAFRVTTFGEAAIFIGAVYGGLGVLYAGRAWENVKAGKHAADVEIAKAGAPQ
ncbi:hypothetical protein [Phenylobacterium sp.]|uniref:hypothetical protein n=1 Tax=Phenylobacterium sp. TaxID=1871053 RepID=UPI00271B3092|nr:hypothetical protein [Phenylobacterium sp.]MDO8800029.1 hypothetical protein [Phenylobacterium sp.]